MRPDLLAAIDDEIDALEAELAADVRMVRLKALREVRALYADGERSQDRAAGPTGASQTDASHAGLNGPAGPRTISRRISPNRSQALDAVAMHLQNRTGPVPTKELLEHIVSIGIEIGGTNPLNNLSAILSNSGRFDSHGRNGWTLRRVRSDDEMKLEAMQLASTDIVNQMGDDELTANIQYLQEFNSIRPAVSSNLKTAYREILEEDYINDGSNKFREIFESTLKNEYENRFVSNNAGRW